MPETRGSENQVLRHLRGKEREPILTTPPAVRIAAACIEPATATATIRREEARMAARNDGFVHGDDPPETHGLDLLVRELFTDEAGDVGVRLHEFHLVGLGTDLLGDAVIVLEERTLEDDDLMRPSGGGLEVFGTKNGLPVIFFDTITFRLRPRDPLVASRRLVERDREVDDAINFTPAPDLLGDDQFVAKETHCPVVTAKFFDDRVQLTGRKTRRSKIGTHDILHTCYVARCNSSHPRRNQSDF